MWYNFAKDCTLSRMWWYSQASFSTVSKHSSDLPYLAQIPSFKNFCSDSKDSATII